MVIFRFLTLFSSHPLFFSSTYTHTHARAHPFFLRRCGSTLFSKLISSVSHTVSYSEPDIFTDLAFNRFLGEEKDEYTHTCIYIYIYIYIYIHIHIILYYIPHIQYYAIYYLYYIKNHVLLYILVFGLLRDRRRYAESRIAPPHSLSYVDFHYG